VECVLHDTFVAGDHKIIIGLAVSGNVSEGEPLHISGAPSNNWAHDYRLRGSNALIAEHPYLGAISRAVRRHFRRRV